MDDESWDRVYSAREIFLDKVRDAFREMKGQLNEEEAERATALCQDNLSLYHAYRVDAHTYKG